MAITDYDEYTVNYYREPFKDLILQYLNVSQKLNKTLCCHVFITSKFDVMTKEIRIQVTIIMLRIISHNSSADKSQVHLQKLLVGYHSSVD